MTKQFLVSVVMPVHNGEQYLAPAIESILAQTLTDFEFIIINDGSTDGTAAILNDFARQDGRIRIYHFLEPNGIEAALNHGCTIARTDYVAIMHSDDFSHTDRLAKQYEFMKQHSEVGVLGTWLETIDQNGNPGRIRRLPTEPFAIRWHFMYMNCIAHPSVLMRRRVGAEVNFYRREYVFCEDFDLWFRLYNRTQFSNLPEPLVQYRIWSNSSSSRHADEQNLNAARLIQQRIQQQLGLQIGLENALAIWKISAECEGVTAREVRALMTWVPRIYDKYLTSQTMSLSQLEYIQRDVARIFALLAKRATAFSRLNAFRLQLMSRNMENAASETAKRRHT